MFFKKPKQYELDPQMRVSVEDFDLDKDLQAIIDFLRESVSDIKAVYVLCKKMQQLREKEKHLVEGKAPQPSLQYNTKEQIEVFDKLLEAYDFFDEDVEVNKQRVKFIAKTLKQLAKDRNVNPELLRSLEKREWWMYNS